MISILDKHNCCGCQACHEACPARCITMVADAEGFLYPEIQAADCLECHRCEQVCPQLNPPRGTDERPLNCYAAQSKDTKTRLQSSSGGVFSLLAEAILKQGGVVFGARFDDNCTVYHSFTETMEGLSPFRGSKYAQSDMRKAYTQVGRFLQQKRPVLFTGTPCQIAGLRGYLQGKEDENLYLVSVVCHGVPSPKVWKTFLDNITDGVPPTSVNMRDKENGWSQYKMVIRRDGKTLQDIPATDTPFMRAFLSNQILRPACYSCRFRSNHGSDLTLGDYWGIQKYHPNMSDNKGTSLILAYTQKGQQLLAGLALIREESRYEDAVRENPSIINASPAPAGRASFWKAFQRRGADALDIYTNDGYKARIQRFWYRFRP